MFSSLLSSCSAFVLLLLLFFYFHIIFDFDLAFSYFGWFPTKFDNCHRKNSITKRTEHSPRINPKKKWIVFFFFVSSVLVLLCRINYGTWKRHKYIEWFKDILKNDDKLNFTRVINRCFIDLWIWLIWPQSSKTEVLWDGFSTFFFSFFFLDSLMKCIFMNRKIIQVYWTFLSCCFLYINVNISI